uniref:Secreted protein n=1 Tax=Panstrongylus lignarius TaxID=156445 RepID=A0A224Y4P7_9HEMI
MCPFPPPLNLFFKLGVLLGAVLSSSSLADGIEDLSLVLTLLIFDAAALLISSTRFCERRLAEVRDFCMLFQ